MIILIAPDKFKGSLDAKGVAEAIRKGLKVNHPNAQYLICPMADGGDGSIDLLKEPLGLDRVDLTVQDPLFRQIDAYYHKSKTEAFVDFSIASGLKLLDDSERNPMFTSSIGTGQIIRHAIDSGLKQINLFIGGSSTNDAGIGIAQGLGFKFLDSANKSIRPIGQNLSMIKTIVPVSLPADVSFRVICDVTNPFFGEDGAAFTYAAQKGASPLEVKMLDRGLQLIHSVFESQGMGDVSQFPGAGAAGGVGGGMKAMFNATLLKGFDWFSEQLNLDALIDQADWIITGEGQVDASSLQGKVVGGFVKRARKKRKKLAVVCGINRLDSDSLKKAGINQIQSIMEMAPDQQQAMSKAEIFIELLSKKWNLDD